MTKSNEQNILVGIDVGSTTTKIVAVDANDRHQLLFSDYARHHANQIASVIRSIKKFCGHIRDKKIRLCLTGSGAKPVASILKVPFVHLPAAHKKMYLNHEDPMCSLLSDSSHIALLRSIRHQLHP